MKNSSEDKNADLLIITVSLLVTKIIITNLMTHTGHFLMHKCPGANLKFWLKGRVLIIRGAPN